MAPSVINIFTSEFNLNKTKEHSLQDTAPIFLHCVVDVITVI